MTEATAPEDTQSTVLRNSMVMAAGTVVSRASGFVRSMLLAAALGVGLHADIFTIANTVPNMLYILLAGGVFNAVLVPQLVRAMKNDADGGSAYLSRVVTLAILFLGAVTVVLVAAAPVVMDLLLSDSYDRPDMAQERQSAIDFARFCLPQVFFYGMFVLLGQVLNSRGRFGPMMWAPIANNVISVAVLATYLVAFGAASSAESDGGFTPGQEALLGIGSTAGIAAQLLILLPYLRSAGVRYRPRFDFRGVGLGHTLRLGAWTVGFVIVNQIAYTVVVRLGSSGTASDPDGTGITIYSNAMLVAMVPHSIITVSLATAILPRLSRSAAADDMAGLSATLGATLRTALVVMVPFAALMPAIALPLAHALWGYGAAAETYPRFETPLMLFTLGVVVFTVHYLVLRAFYALELNRLVFYIQCVIAATNVAVAITLVRATTAEQTTASLIVAYTASYAVGGLISVVLLARHLRRRAGVRAAHDRRSGAGASAGGGGWGAFAVRIGSAAAGVLVVALVLRIVVEDTIVELFGAPNWLWSAVEVAIVGSGTIGVYLACAGLFRLSEVTAVTGTLVSRVRRS